MGRVGRAAEEVGPAGPSAAVGDPLAAGDQGPDGYVARPLDLTALLVEQAQADDRVGRDPLASKPATGDASGCRSSQACVAS